MEHTKEPWVFDRQSEVPHVMSEDGLAIFDACPWGSISDPEKMSANARRAVACVNACAGMTTEEVEADIVVGGYKALIACSDSVIDQLTAQRDELLAALHRISLGSQSSETAKGDLGREARTAIAKIKPPPSGAASRP